MKCGICGDNHPSKGCPSVVLVQPKDYSDEEKNRLIEILNQRVADLEAVLSPMADGTVLNPRDVRDGAQVALGWTRKKRKSGKEPLNTKDIRQLNAVFTSLSDKSLRTVADWTEANIAHPLAAAYTYACAAVGVLRGDEVYEYQKQLPEPFRATSWKLVRNSQLLGYMHRDTIGRHILDVIKYAPAQAEPPAWTPFWKDAGAFNG